MFRRSFEKKIPLLVREFFASHADVKLIAVTGSTGKTSAKIAIGTVLSQRYAIAMPQLEPKSHMQTLLQIMGVCYPEGPEKKWGFFARRNMYRAVKKRARAEHPEVQVIVQEFSPQTIGFHDWFKTVILPDIAVITSVTTGRMRVEHTIEEVAQEMITLGNNSRMALINRDDIEGRFAAFVTNPNITTYGTSGVAEYYFDEHDFSLTEGHFGAMVSPEYPEGIQTQLKLLGEHNLRPAVAAMAVAVKLGMDVGSIQRGLAALRPIPGRMQLLRGADGTMLLDDSYSASPSTTTAAIQTLYSLSAPQKIAVLGNINGLRESMPQEMSKLGYLCNPNELDWVVTVGEMANQYLAPSARQRGCQVKECKDAIEAGSFVRDKLKKDGIALFKGSSGGVWLEEAIKINLHTAVDENKLVRQTPEWIARKNAFFSRFSD